MSSTTSTSSTRVTTGRARYRQSPQEAAAQASPFAHSDSEGEDEGASVRQERGALPLVPLPTPDEDASASVSSASADASAISAEPRASPGRVQPASNVQQAVGSQWAASDEGSLAQLMRAQLLQQQDAAAPSQSEEHALSVVHSNVSNVESTLSPEERAAEITYSRYLDSAALAEPDDQEDQHVAASSVAYQPPARFTSQVAAQAERAERAEMQAQIDRLQAQLHEARSAASASPSAAVVATVVAADAPAPPSPPVWSERDQQRTTSARQRILEREMSLREYLASTTRWYALMLLRTALQQLILARGSALVQASMELPYVRDVALLLSDITVSLADWAVHTPLARKLPCSDWLYSLLAEPELQQLWSSVPEWPLEQVKAWSEGPLRPLFALLASMPLSSLLFELHPLSEEQGGAAAALDDSRRQSSWSRSLRRGLQQGLSGVSSVAAAAAHVADPASASSASSASLPSELLSELHSLRESHQSLLSLLQADRADLRQRLERMEARLNEQQQQQTPTGSTQRAGAAEEELSAWEEVEPSHAHTDGLRQRRTPAAGASSFTAAEPRTDLQQENARLRSQVSARELELQAQRRDMQALRLDSEALQQRIRELEQQTQGRK